MTITDEPFQLTEVPRPVAAWSSEATLDRFAELNADLRRLMRLQAEQRRASREADRKHDDSTRKLLLGVVEILDGLDRVFGNIQASGAELDDRTRRWIKNFRAVRGLGSQLLEDQGVKRIENFASGFDPAWHTVLETSAEAGQAEGTILEELQPGYVWHKQLLRKVGVRVNKLSSDGASNA